MNLIRKRYKDKCDRCHKMKECSGYNKLLLCQECKREEQENNCNSILIYDKDNQAKFDL